MRLLPLLAIIGLQSFSIAPLVADEQKAKDEYLEALKTFDSRGYIVKIYSDLFTSTPINLSVAAAFPVFDMSLPTDVPRQFASISGRMAWEGDKLKLLVSVTIEIVYTMSGGEEERRNLGVQDLPLVLSPGQTLTPVEINGKVLKVSLLPTPQ
ncbi:MAG: hypothetical protein WC657_08365 [Candidatus Paceibacterota bacterium]|jgi:hypothetical protein